MSHWQNLVLFSGLLILNYVPENIESFGITHAVINHRNVLSVYNKTTSDKKYDAVSHDDSNQRE